MTKNSDIVYTLTVNINYPEYLHPLHRDLPFLPKKIVINQVTKCALLYMSQNIITTSFKIWINSKKSTQSHKI